MIKLPIDDFLPQVARSLEAHPNLVVTAAPGAGKTTRLPAYLARTQLFAPNSSLYMIEPRRLAARASAERIAFEQGWHLGNEVGYQVRFENKTRTNTRLQILTEGIFTRRLQSNPELTGVSALILDEFHERSASTDLALAFARELQQLSRPDLKIIVMSATLQAERIANFLGDCPVIDVPGLTHPVDLQFSREPQLLLTGDVFYDRVLDQIKKILSGALPSRGDILVFLPGAGEIENLRRRLQTPSEKYDLKVVVLHGSLSLNEQDRVMRPSMATSAAGQPKRRVILATNIAETSLTIPGVGTVLDTGLARVLKQEGLGFPRLVLSRTSRFSAIQRTGRAGREAPGFAYRLWTKLDEAARPESETPELLRTDISETVLLLASQGLTDPKSFSWFEAPPALAIEASQKLLRDLDAIDSSGAVTEMGRKIMRWPIHPRLGRLMEEACANSCLDLGAKLATILSERDLLSHSDRIKNYASEESDLLARLYVWNESPNRPEFTMMNRAYEQLVQTAQKWQISRPMQIDEELMTEKLLLAAFPDRLAKNRESSSTSKETRALMMGGSGVKVAEFSFAKRAPLFFCLDAMAARPAAGAVANSARSEMLVTMASRLRPESLKNLCSSEIKLITKTFFDADTKQVVTEAFQSFRGLPIENGKRRKATAAEAAQVLPELIYESFDQVLQASESAKTWLDRLEFLRGLLPEENWPEFDGAMRREISNSLAMGEDRLEGVLQKDVILFFEMSLSEKQKQILHKEAPEKLHVPSGSFMKVHYPPDRSPYIEARLQELFGWLETPTLARGQVKLVIHLLGPNYRPVQVTSDLKGFWTSAYHEVRKELKARYPKHDWPSYPFSATASAKRGPRKT